MTSPALSRIMMVEDEPDIRAIAKLALESLGGYTVEPCSNGAEAVTRALAFKPDVILLDVMMPGMDGPATLKTLRTDARTAHIPVIFMTAKVQAQEIEAFKAQGALSVIAKPFDPMTLSGVIKGLWERHHG